MDKTGLAIISFGCILVMLSVGLDGENLNILNFIASISTIFFGIILYFLGKKKRG